MPRISLPLFVSVALVATSCVSVLRDEQAPAAAATIDGFIDAWNDQDAVGMHRSLDAASRAKWPARRIDRALRQIVDDAVVSSFEVRRSGSADTSDLDLFPPDERATEGPSAEVSFEIEYRVAALDEPVSLRGELELTIPPGQREWKVAWSRGDMFPGVAGGWDLDARTRYLRRGRILDRRGRALASGSGRNRRYPRGSTGGMTVGHLEEVSRKQARRGETDPAPGELVGASGLEEAYEERLRGEPNVRLLVVDRAGNRLETVARADGRRGKDVRATLDARVQRAAEAAFGGTTGGAVVLDPGSGDLLAVVPAGSFDPGNYVGVRGIDPFNRALSGLYPPGSALKVMTAAAALDSRVVKPTTNVTGPAEYRGVRNFESGAFGTIPFATALKFSVNTAFAQVAEDLGTGRITRYARRFGFNRPPRLRVDAATSSFPRPQDEGDLMWGAIGQAQVLATPMQMATVAATIANAGMRMEPRLTFVQPKQVKRVVKRRVARKMVELMENVVEGGTGTAARIGGIRVAGKTGTAEVDVDGERRNHAWFVAFAPASDPKVAVAVVSEYGGVGGQVAAPIARRILQAVLPLVR